MSVMKTVALMGSLAASAYAHGRIISIDVDGTEYEGFTSAMVSSGDASGIIAWSADNQDNGFVGPESYGSSDIACHKSGAPGGKVAPVAAGGSIKLQWDTWPESHHGPVIDYLAKCAGDDCTSVAAGDLSFFKIDEAGLNDGAAQDWASDDLIADGNSWTVTIPEDLAPGQYVLRHEIIALHSAQDTNGAQNYPQCINIEVTGSGSNEPEGTPATSLYSADDAGISLSIYNGLTSYEIPGPALISGASSGSGSSSGSTGGSSSAAASSGAASTAASSSAPVATGNAPSTGSNSTASATSASSAPATTGEPTFAGESSAAATTPCTTTITITGSAAPTATGNAPVDTSNDDADEEEYEEDDEEDNSSSGSNSGSSSSGSSSSSTPTTTAPASDISAVASSVPSSVLDAPIPTETSSSDKADGKPSKALPEGFTLKDLLEWVNYLLSKAYNSEGVHARDVVRR